MSDPHGASMIASAPVSPSSADLIPSAEAGPHPASLPGRRASGAQMRIVIVEWRIKRGREAEFVHYWSQNEAIGDGSGLIGEYLSHVEDQKECHWITLEFGAGWTTYVNVGFWSDADAFRREVGPKIDDRRPALPFEHEKRRRTFLCPDRWRVGGTSLPSTSHSLVQ